MSNVNSQQPADENTTARKGLLFLSACGMAVIFLGALSSARNRQREAEEMQYRQYKEAWNARQADDARKAREARDAQEKASKVPVKP